MISGAHARSALGRAGAATARQAWLVAPEGAPCKSVQAPQIQPSACRPKLQICQPASQTLGAPQQLSSAN